MGESKERSKRKIPKTALVIAIVLALIAGIAFAVYANSDVSEDQVRADFLETDYFKKGIMQSEYVEDSDYRLTDFSVEDQSDEPASDSGNADTKHRVDFSGTMENDSFRTDFIGHVYYVKDGGSWMLEVHDGKNNGFEIDDSTTTPLKGVDYFEQSSSYELSGEPSTFNDTGNVYTSVLTKTITYDFWFATDEATKTQAFIFDEDAGWIPQSEAEQTGETTEWHLAGENFDHEWIGNDGTLESSLGFTECDDGKVAANYTLDYFPPEDVAYRFDTYYEVHLPADEGSGILTGVPVHTFGESTFSFDLVSNDDGVTFEISGNISEEEKLTVVIHSNVPYRSSPGGKEIMIDDSTNDYVPDERIFSKSDLEP